MIFQIYSRHHNSCKSIFRGPVLRHENGTVDCILSAVLEARVAASTNGNPKTLPSPQAIAEHPGCRAQAVFRDAFKRHRCLIPATGYFCALADRWTHRLGL
jgi:hypothetical protein